MANHVRLDFNLVEFLARVDTNDAANHLGDDNHVTEVSLNEVGLLVGPGFLLGLAEFLDQTHGLALQAAVEPAAGTSVNDITELLRREVQEPAVVETISQKPFSSLSACHRCPLRNAGLSEDLLVKVDAAVGKLAELSSLLHLY